MDKKKNAIWPCVLSDPITKAIQKGYHACNMNSVVNQTWADFEQAIPGRYLFIFGVGKGADYYFRRRKRYPIEGVIDNNIGLQGMQAWRMLPGEAYDHYRDLCISDISVLRNYAPDKIVVLVTSLKYYEAIFAQLNEYGIQWKFSLLCMEANRRKDIGLEEEESLDAYREKCCREEIRNNKIVFYNQGNYGGHGKYITEQLLKRRKDLEIVWLVRQHTTEAPQGVHLVSNADIRNYIYEMETAKIWVFDYWVPSYIIKRSEQIYVQVKHWSSVTLKTFGMDSARFQNVERFMDTGIYNGEIMDYLMVGSKFDEETCRKGFLFQGEVWKVGSPRTDILFSPGKVQKKIFECYGIEQNCSLCLYAPTFREKGPEAMCWTGDLDLDYVGLKAALEQRFGGEWMIVLRLHPLLSHESKNIERPSWVVDASDYPDSQELVAVSEILITDYSSIMFEPAFVKKPVFLFAPDRKEYINGERELLIDYNSLPFSAAESNEELAQCIQTFHQKEYEDGVTRFLEQYGVHEDGHASERAAEHILGLFSE